MHCQHAKSILDIWWNRGSTKLCNDFFNLVKTVKESIPPKASANVWGPKICYILNTHRSGYGGRINQNYMCTSKISDVFLWLRLITWVVTRKTRCGSSKFRSKQASWTRYAERQGLRKQRSWMVKRRWSSHSSSKQAQLGNRLSSPSASLCTTYYTNQIKYGTFSV